MSRIGRKHIDVPAGVTVNYADNVVTVKGKLGELKQTIASNDISVKIGAGAPTTKSRRARSTGCTVSS